jgi:hypothetical protein
MFKISIAADFRKNNSSFAAAQKNSRITAHTLRANTAETSGRNGAPFPTTSNAQATLRC